MKIVLHLHTGFCGSDSWEFWEVDDKESTKNLDDLSWDRALENAAIYGIYPTNEQPDDYDEEEGGWDSDQYSDNIEGSWYHYDSDKHDAYRVGNDNSWMQY